MKKIIIRILIALVVVVVLVFVVGALFLDQAIKKGVETFGPKLTKANITLQSVHLSLLSGSGTIKGLVVDNPAGFKTPTAISVGSATISLKPASLLSDKIVIKSIEVQAPEITYETDLKHNNLNQILANVQEATGGGEAAPAQPTQASQPAAAKPAKKLEVDNFVITGGKVHVAVTALGGGSATLPLPDIHLQDLGTGPEGITPAELTQKVLTAIEQGSAQAASGAVTDIGKGAVYVTKDLQNTGSNALQKVTKGIGNLFK